MKYVSLFLVFGVVGGPCSALTSGCRAAHAGSGNIPLDGSAS